MRTSARLLKNTFFLSIAQIANPVLSMILVLILSRKLGAENLGVYSTVLTLFTFFNLFSVLGLNGLIVRDVAANRSKAPSYLSNMIFLGFISSLVFFAVMIFSTHLLNYSEQVTKAIFIMGFALLFYTLSQYMQSMLQAFEKMEFCSLMTIGGTLWKVIFGVFSLLKGYGVIAIILVVCTSHLFSMILGFYFVHKKVSHLSFRPDFSCWKYLLKQVPTFLTLSVVVMIYWNMDILMLSKMKGMAEVGFYTAAYRIMFIGKSVANTYIVAIFPIISRFFKENKNAFEQSCIQSIKYLLILTLPVAILTIFLGDHIINLLYGSEFIQSAVTLKVVIWTIVLFPIANLVGNGLIASHHQKIDLLVNSIGALFNVILNLILIPRIGHVGAGLATLLSIGFLLFIQNIFVRKYLFKIPYIHIISKPLLAGLFMILSILLLKILNIYLAAVLGLIGYIIMLYIIKTFTREELDTVRNIWNEKKYFFSLKK